MPRALNGRALSSVPAPPLSACAWRSRMISRFIQFSLCAVNSLRNRRSTLLLLEPAQDLVPVVLVRADDFGVVVEDSFAETGDEHVTLRVAQLSDDRKRQLLHFLERLLRGGRPWLEPVRDQADGHFAFLDARQAGDVAEEHFARIQIDARRKDRDQQCIDVLEQFRQFAGANAGRTVHYHALRIVGYARGP